MAIVVTKADNTITVTGGTEGTRADCADIFAEDQSQGWGVFANPTTGVYVSTAHIHFGDETTPTYFELINITLIIDLASAQFYMKSNAYLWFGKIDGDGSTYDGSRLIFLQVPADIFNQGSSQVSTIKIYDSYLYVNNAIQVKMYSSNGTYEIINSTIEKSQIIRVRGGSSILRRVNITQNTTYGLNPYGTLGEVNDIQVVKSEHAIYWNIPFGDSIIKNLKAFGLTGEGIITNNSGSYSLYIIDSELENWDVEWLGTGTGANIYRQYSFNIHVKDKDGNNLSGVTCLFEDKDDAEVFSVSTAGDGTITEQIATYGEQNGTDRLWVTKSPHKLTLSKANYETLVIDEITMDELKDLEFELLPALAVGDVRLATDFGEDKTGTLDLPAQADVRDSVDFDNATKTGVLDLPVITDVEKDVVFDSTTKTGTFKEPGIANVKEGIQYGADDTEFTGTFVRNVVKLGTVVGQSTVGIVVGE